MNEVKTMIQDVRVKVEEILILVSERLAEAGLNLEHADLVADVLTHADLRGVRSHGVMRTEHYVKRLKAGSLNPNPTFSFKQIRNSACLLSADGGMGHAACGQAMHHAIKTARKTGIAMVAVEDGSHCGALSYFVLQAASENMIGIAITQTDKCVAPFGGIKPFFGTNPIAFGFPCNNKPPVVLDMATSNTAYGKVMHARESNSPIPDDWGLDENGTPTTDPHQVQALTPFGGYKGYGIGLVIDVLTGILLGAKFGPHITAMYGDYEKKRGLASLMIAVDPATFISLDNFKAQMETMVTELHTQTPGPGFDKVQVPGDREIRCEAENRKDGIPLLPLIYAFLKGEKTASGLN
jgi:ureidoglycolate dehydrogenase (NAD+)